MAYKDPKELLAAIVKHCEGQHDLENHDLEDKFNEYQKTGDDWILILVFAKCVKGHVHQARMKWKDVADVVIKLLKLANLFNIAFNNFEELYLQVKCNVQGITFAQGALTIYDIALRIGKLLKPKVAPKKYVYLADCTKKVYKIIYPNEHRVGYRVEYSKIEQDFGGISSEAIENLLCHFHQLFEKVNAGGTVTDQEIIIFRDKRMKPTSTDWTQVEIHLQQYKAELLSVASNRKNLMSNSK